MIDASLPMLTASDFSYATSDDDPWRRAAIKCIERLSGKARLWTLYEGYRRETSGDDFFEQAIRRLELTVKINAGGLAAIPETGPLVVIANHPLGVVDGLLLGYLISQVRKDFRILVHSALCKVPEPRPYFLPIDFLNTRQAQKTNLETRRAALADLEAGRVVGIFPSGGIATARHPFARVNDLEWKAFTASMVTKSHAPVLPVLIDGRTSRLFQLFSQINMELRASLLFREAVKMMGNDVKATIGQPLTPDHLSSIADRRDLMAYLRRQTFDLDLASGDGLQTV